MKDGRWDGRNVYVKTITVLITALLFLTLCGGCSGGFGGDSEGADRLGPGIFGPDSGRGQL